MKEITSITAEGLHYMDDEGNSQFIDFEICLQNYIKGKEGNLGSSLTEEDKAFWQKAKYVSVRVTFREPPALEFYTEPRIYFEFPTSDDVWEVATRIKRAGWRTNDGE